MYVVAYSVSVRPFIDDSDDILDIFNESCIMILCYFSVTYTQFVPDNKTKYDIGWIAVAVFALNLGCNLTYIIYKTVTALRKKCKDRSKKKKRVAKEDLIKEREAEYL